MVCLCLCSVLYGVWLCEKNESQMFAQKFSLFSTVIVLLVYIADIYQEDFVWARARPRVCVYLCVGMVTNSTFEKDIYLYAFLRLIYCLFAANSQQNSFHHIFPHSSIQYTAIYYSWNTSPSTKSIEAQTYRDWLNESKRARARNCVRTNDSEQRRQRERERASKANNERK